MGIENLRYERKFRVEHLPFESVRQLVRMLPLGLRPSFPERRINNIYFDTPTLNSYHENTSGTGGRKKFRIRWYGERGWPEGPLNLEIKGKDFDLGQKNYHQTDTVPEGDLRRLLDAVRKLPGTPPALQAILANTYLRSYYATSSGSFRITIDRDQRFSGLLWQNLKRFPGRGLPFQAADTAIILELKYDSAFDDDIDEILRYLPFRLQKNSKYAQGVELLYLR